MIKRAQNDDGSPWHRRNSIEEYNFHSFLRRCLHISIIHNYFIYLVSFRCVLISREKTIFSIIISTRKQKQVRQALIVVILKRMVDLLFSSTSAMYTRGMLLFFIIFDFFSHSLSLSIALSLVLAISLISHNNFRQFCSVL